MKHASSAAPFALLALFALFALLAAGCASRTLAPDADPPRTPNRSNPMTTSTSPQEPLPRSPLTVADLDRLRQVVLLGDDDLAALRQSLPILEPQVEQILDVWYGFVGSVPHLLHYFTDASTGKPDGDYLAGVRKRFGQWILATARANYDQQWLDQQHEIGLRHHSTRKNRTDGARSVPIVHFRYLPALVYPVTATLKPFLEKGGHDAAAVDRMHQAWIKSVLLQTILWSHPYVHDGQF